MRLQWMNEFSDVGMEVNSNNNLKMAKIESQHLEYHVSKPDLTGSGSELQLSEEAIMKEKKKKALRRTSTITYLFKKIQDNMSHFQKLTERNIDLFQMEKDIGRDHLLPMMGVNIMMKLGVQTIVDEPKMAAFMDKVFTTYH